MLDFYLGTHKPHWLALDDLRDVNLCVSYASLKDRKKLPRSVTKWMLDSFAFKVLEKHGDFVIRARDYARDATTYSKEIGALVRAGIQDWMCEDFILAKTSKSIAQHQELTVNSFVELKSIAPDLPWLPTLQGFSSDDYLRCRDLYAKRGVDLAIEEVVGLGSVCRRQSSREIRNIVWSLYLEGLRLHGFGVKTAAFSGKYSIANLLASADSMAWSYAGMFERLPDCKHGAKSCSNCLRYALRFRDRVLARASEVTSSFLLRIN